MPSGYLSLEGLTAMTWTLTSVAILLTIGRYILRYKNLGRLCLDDAAHALALFTLIAMVSTFTALFPFVYLIDDYARGQAGKPSAPQYLVYLKLQVAVSVLFWVCVYAVKIAFLLLYRMLFVVSKASNVIWWSITAFTIVAFWICLAGELTTCGPSKNLLKEEHCESKAGVKNFIIIIEYSGVVHVLSDFIIMAFPLKVLKGLQIRTSQKIGLSSVFCLAILVVIFDITRTVFSVISARGGAAGAGTVLWDILEATVAVIVSCLPTYGTIFTQKKQKKSKRNYTNITGQENLVKTQPSLELTSFENAMDGASNDRMKSRRVLGEDQHDLELPELFEQG